MRQICLKDLQDEKMKQDFTNRRIQTDLLRIQNSDFKIFSVFG